MLLFSVAALSDMTGIFFPLVHKLSSFTDYTGHFSRKDSISRVLTWTFNISVRLYHSPCLPSLVELLLQGFIWQLHCCSVLECGCGDGSRCLQMWPLRLQVSSLKE